MLLECTTEAVREFFFFFFKGREVQCQLKKRKKEQSGKPLRAGRWGNREMCVDKSKRQV